MGNSSAFYYHSKLASYNYTIFDLHSKAATCYFWHEGEGTLQADCFASCLVDFLTHNESCQVARKIIVYSDGCSYQNRNFVLSNALLHFSIFARKERIQKILEKGHTQMECDSVHATTEKSIKNRNVYAAADYVRFAANAKCSSPYTVNYLCTNFFSYFSQLNYYSSILPGCRVGDSVVTDLRQILYRDGCIYYKLGFDDQKEFKSLPRWVRNNTGIIAPLFATELPAITLTMYQDLQQLKRVIPQDYHFFYYNLRTTTSPYC